MNFHLEVINERLVVSRVLLVESCCSAGGRGSTLRFGPFRLIFDNKFFFVQTLTFQLACISDCLSEFSYRVISWGSFAAIPRRRGHFAPRACADPDAVQLRDQHLVRGR